MEKGDDPYEILGVGYDATDDEIKKAYRKGALKFHPDKQKTDEDKEKANEVFPKISAAYDMLTDPVKRYDWKQANEAKMKGGSSSDTGAKSSTTSSSSAARPPPPRRQNTEPTPRPPTRRSSVPTPSTQQRSAPPAPSSKTPPPPGNRRTRNGANTNNSNGTKPPPQQRKTPASAPPPPNSAFSWSRPTKPKDDSANAYPSAAGKKENMNVPPNTRASKPKTAANAYPDWGTGKKENVKTNTTASTASSYPSAAAKGKKEEPNAPNTTYSAAGIKEDLRPVKGKKKKMKKPEMDSSYHGAGVGTKEDLRSPPGRKKRTVGSSASVSADTSYGGAGVGTKEDLRSPTKKSPKKRSVSVPKTRKGADTSYSAKPNMKEDPHKIESSYSMSGQNGYPVERTYTPQTPRRRLKGLSGAASVSGPPLHDMDDQTVSSRHTYAAGQERAPGTPGRRKPTLGRSRSNSPRKGKEGNRTSRTGGKKNVPPSVNEVHDPFATFEEFVRLEFADEEFAQNPTGEWVKKGMFGGEKKETKLKARALEYYDPNAVMSMSTSTKTEKRKDDGLYDVKTITKILRGDGSVETVRQASVCDKETSKTIPKDKTVTVTREATKKKKK